MSEDVNILTRENQGNVAYGPQVQKMAISLASGANEFVAAVTGQQVQIMSMSISVEQPVTMTLKTEDDMIIPLHAGGRGGVNFPGGAEPWFVGKIGQDINLNCSASPGVSAGVVIVYRMARTS
jgi:hypothetical protein